MRIVLDAMGTDAHPTADVAGAIKSCRQYSEDTIILVGDQQMIDHELQKQGITHPSNLDILHADEVITMNDKPSVVLKHKPQSSMHVGMNLVKTGDADAFVTMGNTGAAHAIATLGTLRRIKGVKRPALTAIYPIDGEHTIFLDMGANSDSRVEWLEQFAIMGNIYATNVLGRQTPAIATLSNGEEEGKGNQLIREAQERIKNLDLNYIGHVEPKEILEGKADVIVVDGFVGNIFMKTFEASVSYLTSVIREELTGGMLSTIGAALSRGAFQRVRERLDPQVVGGAPLLGVNGVVIIGHGSSNATAVAGAINQARQAVNGNVVDEIRRGLTEVSQASIDSGK